MRCSGVCDTLGTSQQMATLGYIGGESTVEEPHLFLIMLQTKFRVNSSYTCVLLECNNFTVSDKTEHTVLFSLFCHDASNISFKSYLKAHIKFQVCVLFCFFFFSP